MKKFLFVVLLCGISPSIFGQESTCDFQEPCSILMPIPDSSGWQIGTVSTPYFSGIRNGFRGLVTDSSGNYQINHHDSFEVHIANGAPNVIMRFSHVFHTDSLLDGGYIEASYDKGKTWYDIHTKDSNILPISAFMYSPKGGYSPLSNDRLGFTGNSGDTVATYIDWTWYILLKKQPDSTYVRFHFISDSIPDNKEGWLIYNIEVLQVFSGGFAHSHSDLGIRIFPNPSSGIYQIDANVLNDEPYLLQVYDLHGKVLLERNSESPVSELDLRPFDGKLFLYRIVTEDGRVQSGRLVKE